MAMPNDLSIGIVVTCATAVPMSLAVWAGAYWTDEGGPLSSGELRRRSAASTRIELAAVDDEANAIVKHARRSEAAPRLSALVEVARSEPGIPVKPTDFDPDPFLLNVENSTIDLRP